VSVGQVKSLLTFDAAELKGSLSNSEATVSLSDNKKSSSCSRKPPKVESNEGSTDACDMISFWRGQVASVYSIYCCLWNK